MKKNIVKSMMLMGITAVFAVAGCVASDMQNNMAKASNSSMVDGVFSSETTNDASASAIDLIYNSKSELVNALNTRLKERSDIKSSSNAKINATNILATTFNISQSTMNTAYNNKLKAQGKDYTVDGTCSEVAATSIYYNMATRSGSDVHSESTYFIQILDTAFQLHAYPAGYDPINKKYYNTYRDLLCNVLETAVNDIDNQYYAVGATFVIKPTASKYYPYLKQKTGCTGSLPGHTVVVAGYGTATVDVITTSGSSYPKTEYFYIINNGWANSRNGKVGAASQYQYVLEQDLEVGNYVVKR